MTRKMYLEDWHKKAVEHGYLINVTHDPYCQRMRASVAVAFCQVGKLQAFPRTYACQTGMTFEEAVWKAWEELQLPFEKPQPPRSPSLDLTSVLEELGI